MVYCPNPSILEFLKDDDFTFPQGFMFVSGNSKDTFNNFDMSVFSSEVSLPF